MRAERTAAAAAHGGWRSGGALIRINADPKDAAVRGAGVSLPAGALSALTAIDARLRHSTHPSTAFRLRD
jgi:hypothetical protein